MNISKINNYPQTTFGYNKRANISLSKKLEESEKTPVIQTMQKIQNDCIFIEDQIKKLEGPKGKNTLYNENQINILSQYLINLKPLLCAGADRFYPELKFTQKEFEAYTDEAVNKLFDKNIGANKALYWRDDIIDKLDEYLDETAQIDYSKAGVDFTFKDENINYTEDNFEKEIEDKQTNNHNSKEENLVSKFTPYSYSPKSLDEVVGINEIKKDIEESIIYAINNPQGAIEREKDYGVKRPNYIILYGPPGCGKTMLAEAISSATGCDMYKMDLANFGTSYINETAVNIKRAFEYVENLSKKTDKPVLLFMDEMDSILSTREGKSKSSKEDNKVVNTILPLLSSLDDKKGNMIVIGATNMYDMLDSAAKSRADNKYYIGLPNENEIQKLLKIHLLKLGKGKNLANNDADLKLLSKELKNYSSRDIVKIMKNAGKQASYHGGDISVQDFKEALKTNSFEKTDENQYKTKNEKVSKIGFLK